ncbi:MAG: AI-2E family transporter [Acidobacteria bacterium]|nr:AI-2E family transporter [Acidobacteriota bacterium]
MDGSKIDRSPNLIVIAACLVIVIAGLRAATSIIVPFLISVFVAVVSLPLQNWLIARKVPVSLAIFLTLTADVLVLVGFGFLVGGQVQGFANEVDEYQKRLDGLVKSMDQYLDPLGFDISSAGIITFLKENVLDIFKNALLRGYSLVSNFVLILLTILFVLFEASGFAAKLDRAIGYPTHNTIRLDKIKKDIQQYLLVKTLVSLATGLLVGISLALMGLDFPVLWGLLAFLLNYIPSLGSIIAAVPPVLLAIIQFGSGRAIGVAAVFLVINVLVGNLIEPHLMGRRLGLSALVVFLSLVFWGWVWGPVGMILSVPLTMIIKIMLENTRDLRWIAVMLGSGKEQHPESK